MKKVMAVMSCLVLAAGLAVGNGFTNAVGTVGTSYSGSDAARSYTVSALLDFSLTPLASNDTVKLLWINGKCKVTTVQWETLTTNHTAAVLNTVNLGDSSSATTYCTGATLAAKTNGASAYTAAVYYPGPNYVLVTALDAITDGVMRVQYHVVNFNL